jgi:hypothetical protein
VEKACNDKDICTTDDQCIDGQCGGTPKYGDPALLSSTFTAGVSGNPGQGLDVDDDPDTCSPVGSCLQGIDNQLSAIAWLMNPGYTEQGGQGAFSIVFDNRSGDFPDGLALYPGRRSDPACDPEMSICDAVIFNESIDGACMPVGILDNPTMTGVSMTAGGTNSSVPIRLLFGSLQIPMTLRMAKVKATVKFNDDGSVRGLVGLLGGCIVKTELVKWVKNTPEDEFEEPYTKEVVSAYVDAYLTPDLDSDGNGTKDCVSAGFVFTMFKAHIVAHEKGL